jgi:hypothetical protein
MRLGEAQTDRSIWGKRKVKRLRVSKSRIRVGDFRVCMFKGFSAFIPIAMHAQAVDALLTSSRSFSIAKRQVCSHAVPWRNVRRGQSGKLEIRSVAAYARYFVAHKYIGEHRQKSVDLFSLPFSLGHFFNAFLKEARAGIELENLSRLMTWPFALKVASRWQTGFS